MIIPEHSKRVFTGVIFDVYQWEQEMFDGSKAIFEALKRPDTVFVLPIKDEKILLSYEEQPHFSRRYRLLGGRIEEEEDPQKAVIRELREETGLASHDLKLFRQSEFGGKIEWNLYYFIAKDCKKVTEPHLDPGERIDVNAVSFAEFIEIVTDESFGDIQFTNHIFRMKNEGRLDDFQNVLFS